MRIFLVRHGESEGNVNQALYRTKADHAIELTERGREQAREAGRAIDNFVFGEGPIYNPFSARFRVWVSPYTRARQTADELLEEMHPMSIIDRREHLLLAEQQFGALDGIAGEEVRDHFPHIADAYDRALEHGGRIFARPWGGESRFDVCTRVHQAFGTFHRDFEKHGIRDLIIVAHGTTIRAFVMMWLHHPYEWFEEEPNPLNGSVRLIDHGKDCGYIHPGS